MSEYRYSINEELDQILVITPSDAACVFELADYQGMVINMTRDEVEERIEGFATVQAIQFGKPLDVDDLSQFDGAPDFSEFKRVDWQGNEVTVQ